MQQPPSGPMTAPRLDRAHAPGARGRRAAAGCAAATLAVGCAAFGPAAAAEGAPILPDWLAVQGQATVVEQANAGFRSPYRGPNSLDPAAKGRETADLTAYLGVRPWRGAELWANGEIDQGFGLSNTLGVAGFPSGEAYKVGRAAPYVQLHRLFLRQTIGLSGETEEVKADLNQFAGRRAGDRIVITVGKFAVTDIFDGNKYAHDPRGDFLNWSIIDAGTFDYAANAWGYSIGGALEVVRADWTVRAGLFDLSTVPNSERLDKGFSQRQAIGELERRFEWRGRAGAVRLTGFLSEGRMGRFRDAVALAQTTGAPATIEVVRRRRQRGGASLNLEQGLADDVGVFLRAGVADAAIEPYEFADIDRTVSGGVSLGGQRWGREDDTVGAALAVNAIGRIHRAYLAAGGLGILVGDGRLPHPGNEQIVEVYYSCALGKPLKLTLDGQLVNHPGYNRDRGPVPLLAARLHAQF